MPAGQQAWRQVSDVVNIAKNLGDNLARQGIKRSHCQTREPLLCDVIRQVTVSRAALATYVSNAVRDRDKLDSNSLNKESEFYLIKKLITSFNFSIM
jgi:hypothetical protein